VKVTTNVNIAIANLVIRYLDSIENVPGGGQVVKERAIVFSSSARFACALSALLKQYAPTQELKDRITAVHAGNQLEPFPRRFLENPTEASAAMDVVIVTSVAQAGHSVETFSTSHSFFFAANATLRDEYQHQGRFRIIGRIDILPFRFAFHQKGRRNAKIVQSARMHAVRILTKTRFFNDARILKHCVGSRRRRLSRFSARPSSIRRASSTII
jgi:hypothetical protein